MQETPEEAAIHYHGHQETLWGVVLTMGRVLTSRLNLN